jgi:hypothetical protein
MPNFLDSIRSLTDRATSTKVDQLEPRRVRRQKARAATKAKNAARKVR